jgi:CubicO group peptidase (beta-lactamase class C family)
MRVDAQRRALIGQLGAAALAGFVPTLPALAATTTSTEATPEALGVASSAITAFIDAAAAGAFEVHSLLVARHGRIAACGWWAPYRREAPHSLYSVSKSFTSTAVGFAVAEGKLKLSDRVVDFFPQQAPKKIDAHLAALRVEHLLTMSVGQASDTTPLVSHSQDWTSTFLSQPIVNEPGSEFVYNSAASYMLSAIVQKVSGEKLVDYLRPRFFDPLGLPAMRWAESPQGVNTGGWGLNATTDTLFKFGQFYLQKGQWNGRQLLPAAWIEQATSFHIQPPAPPGMVLDDLKKSSDAHQGYGYQFWRCRYGGYRADGLLGQFCIVKPELDAVIVMTARTIDPQGLLNLLWEHLLPGFGERPLR